MKAAIGMLCAVLGVMSANASSTESNTVQRIFVEQVVAKMDAAAITSNLNSVEMGQNYLRSRLARPGRRFVCADSTSDAEYRLRTVVSSLRSRENEFSGDTYGHATKTTTWQLDAIFELVRGGDIVLSRTKTSTYEERRPISESQFDNNIFHNMMVAALEQVADDVVDFFDGDEDGPVQTSVGLVPAGGGARAAGQSSSAPADGRPPLAILKPEAGAGVSDQEAMLLWDMLESSVRGGAFRVISRSDLVRMQEEIGFTTSSDLVNLSSKDRARIGMIKTVSKLLTTSVGRIGETYSLSFKLFDASTAEIDTARSETLLSKSIDGFLPLLEGTLKKVLAPAPTGFALMGTSAPVAVPISVKSAFDGKVETALAAAGIAVKPGGEARYRIVPRISEYSVRAEQDGAGYVYRGTIAGAISVEGADVPPVTFNLSGVELGREQGVAPSWLTHSYGRKLVAKALESDAVRAGLSAFSKLK